MEFTNKISSIKTELQQLIGVLDGVDQHLRTASQEFARLAENADDIATLSTAVQRLFRLLGTNNSPFLADLRSKIEEINQELNQLDAGKLTAVTDSLKQQVQAIQSVNRAQGSIARSLDSARQSVGTLKTTLEELQRVADTSGTGLEKSVEAIQQKLTAINGLTNINTVVGSLNALDPTKYNQAADALDRIHATLVALKSANISIDVSAAAEGQKLTKRPIQPVVQAPVVELPVQAPGQTVPKARPRTVQYAQEQGIDLAQVSGTGAHGVVTKADVLKFKQNQPIDIAATQRAVAQAQEQLAEQITQSAQIDQALERINNAKLKALVSAGKAHGLKTPSQFDIAQKYLLPGSNVSQGELYDRSKDFTAIDKNKEGDYLKTSFLRKLRGTTVSTGLGNDLAQIKLDDDETINQLLETRSQLRAEIDRLTKQIQKAPNPQANASLGSRAGGFVQSGIQNTAAFSNDVYRPFAFGVSQFGALVNSVQSVLQGIRKGGPGGFLDAAGGVLKGVNTIANSNAYFGLNLLPKGFGETFNPKRSGTALDLIEVLTGAATGFGRSPIDKNLIRLQGQEAGLASSRHNLKSQLANATDPQEIAALEAAIEKSTKELEALRETISAYRKVISAEVAAETEAAKQKRTPSSGAGLSANASVSVSNVEYQTTLKGLLRNLNSSETLLTKQANQSLRNYGTGTGFSKVFDTAEPALVGDTTLNKLARSVYSAAAFPIGAKIQGVALPTQFGEEKQGTLAVAGVNSGSADTAQVLLHELIHELVDIPRRAANGEVVESKDLGIYSKQPHRYNSDVLVNRFNDPYLDKLSQNADHEFFRTDGDNKLRALRSQITDKTALGEINTGINQTDYLFRPQEQLAHIGESLLSNNTQQQKVLRTVYGDDLFDAVRNKLAADLPDVFGDEPLKILQQRFSTLKTEIDSSVGQYLDETSIVSKIAKFINGFVDEFSASFGDAGVKIKEIVQQVLSGDLSGLSKIPSLLFSGQGANALAGGVNARLNSGRLQQIAGTIPGYGSLLGQVLAPGSESFNRITEQAGKQFLPPLAQKFIGAVNQNGGGAFLNSARTAITQPSQGNFADAINAAKSLNLRNVAIDYFRALFSSVELPGGYVGQLIRETGIPGKIAQSAISKGIDVLQQSAGPNKFTGKLIGNVGKSLIESYLPADVNFEDELNRKIRRTTGKNLESGSYSQTATLDPSTGLTKFALSAKTADGAIVQLNAHVDEFGRKKIDSGKGLTQFADAAREFVNAIPRNLGYRFTESIVTGLDVMLKKLISVQDELGEVANLYSATGDRATKVKADFLYNSVNTAVRTGQGFDEALQTNIKNFKILGNVPDQGKRQQLANQVSQVQLGAQTAFGLSLESSLESIPAILAGIKNGFNDIQDPAEKVTASVGELRNVMDQVVAVQRATGAQGDELVTVYSRLAESAKEYGLNSKQLLAFTASSSVALGKGAEENTNIIKAYLEGTYSEANQGGFAKAGIATKAFNTKTNTIENRSVEDITRDLYNLSQDQTKGVQYQDLLRSIAGPKRAPQIGQIVQGFGNNYDFANQAAGNTQSGTFDTLVQQKSQNISGALNKLNAAGTQFFGSFLVGTGVLDKVTDVIDKLADSAIRLTKFLNDNQAIVKGFVGILASPIRNNILGQFAKDVNIFAPIARGFASVETGVSAAIGEIKDLVNQTSTGGNSILKTVGLIGNIFDEMSLKAREATSTATTGLNNVAAAGQNAASGIQANPKLAGRTSTALPAETRLLAETEAEQAAHAEQLTLAARLSGPPAPILNNGVDIGLLEAGGAAAGTIAGAKPRLGGLSKLFNKDTQLGKFAGNVGDVGGSILPAAGLDLLFGGTGKDNLINTGGAALAGTFLGAITASPQVGIVGYTMAKAFLDNVVDVPGLFGTSEKESGKFAKALATQQFGYTNPAENPDVIKNNLNEAGGLLTDVTKKLGVEALRSASQTFDTTTGTHVATNAVSADTVKSYLEFQQKNNRAPGFLDNFSLNNNETQSTIGLFGDNKKLLDLFATSGVSSVTEFIGLLDQASHGLGPLAEDFAKLNIEEKQRIAVVDQNIKQEQLRAQYESAQDILKKGQDQQTTLEQQLSSAYQVPYGLDKYNAFSPLEQGINKQIGAVTPGDNAQATLERLTRSQESLSQLPQTLQQLVPLAQSLGLNTGGLEQRLYNVGAQGQGQIVQRFQPAIEADRTVQTYELQQRRLAALRSTDLFKSGASPEIAAEVLSLQKALDTDKARYNINKAFLELLKSQSGALLDQTAQVEAQNKTRQLISAGTPAQFTPASIFDTKGTSATQLNNAIDFALQKQRKLESLNPEYRKEFAKDQFLLQSGGDFKGVTGVNQGFVQEFLQQQQQKEAPLQDLSQYSDQQISKILDQARSLQGQAEKLDPSRVGKYENDRILILKKNNDLLAQTGIGQEFLKAAIDANTKSNDTLRGHYNLPSNYKTPTIFDYYDNGGKERGDKNFPTTLGQGLVPLAFAQQLADQIIKGNAGEKGADLADIKGTSQPGARPLFYPTPGTGAIYSEVEPQLIPDSIKTDQNISAAVQRFLDFKQKQIDDLNNAIERGKPTTTQGREKDAFAAPLTPSNTALGPDERPRLPKVISPVGTSPFANNTLLLPDVSGVHPNGANAAGPDDRPSTKAAESVAKFATATDRTKDDITTFGAGVQKVGSSVGTIAAALPNAATGAASLVTSASAFTSAVTTLIAKVATFDLAQTLRNANIQITINGQPVSASSVAISSSTAAGTNTLAVGTAAKTGSKIGGNRQ